MGVVSISSVSPSRSSKWDRYRMNFLMSSRLILLVSMIVCAGSSDIVHLCWLLPGVSLFMFQRPFYEWPLHYLFHCKLRVDIYIFLLWRYFIILYSFLLTQHTFYSNNASLQIVYSIDWSWTENDLYNKLYVIRCNTLRRSKRVMQRQPVLIPPSGTLSKIPQSRPLQPPPLTWQRFVVPLLAENRISVWGL